MRYPSLLNAALLVRGIVADTVWDYAPDLSRTKDPVYPSLTNADGSNITVENLRGTHLFGFDGCGGPQQAAIIQAYNDLTPSSLFPRSLRILTGTTPPQRTSLGPPVELIKFQMTVEITSSVSTYSFSGASHSLTSYQKTPSRNLNRSTSTRGHGSRRGSPGTSCGFGWVINKPLIWDPWLTSFQVRCSTENKVTTGDPENGCKNLKPSDLGCGVPPPRDPSNDEDRLEAYTNPIGAKWYGVEYTRTTFCQKFFNELDSLADAITQGKDEDHETQNNLNTWNNQARVFIHEATHYNYFIDADGTVPFVDDLTFTYKGKDRVKVDSEGYGPYDTRVLTNYRKKTKGGFYTQRNGLSPIRRHLSARHH